MARDRSRLQEELKQTRPFESVYQEAVLSVMKTADLMRRAIGHLLEPRGITPQQYNVLRILRGSGAAGIPTLAIGERLIEEAPGMTRLLDRMEAQGWVKRVRCARDRRQVLCYLTPEGESLLRALDPEVQALQEGYRRRLPEVDAVRLVELLEKLRTQE